MYSTTYVRFLFHNTSSLKGHSYFSLRKVSSATTTPHSFRNLRKYMHTFYLKYHPDVVGTIKESTKHSNESSLQELNSFLDNSTMHCDVLHIRNQPTKQLPRPSVTYSLSFCDKHMKEFQYEIKIPKNLQSKDITTVNEEEERQNLVGRWQIFVTKTLHKILELGKIDVPNPPLEPNVRVLTTPEKSKKQQNRKFVEEEVEKEKEKMNRETAEERNRRLTLEHMRETIKYDGHWLYKAVATGYDDQVMLTKKINVVENLFKNKHFLLKGIPSYEKDEVMFRLKVLLVDYFFSLRLQSSEWKAAVFIVGGNQYAYNYKSGLLAIPADPDIKDFKPFIEKHLPVIYEKEKNDVADAVEDWNRMDVLMRQKQTPASPGYTAPPATWR